MNQIESVHELEKLLKVVEGKKTLTNCYFFGNELVSLVHQGLLYYQSAGENLFLFKSKFGSEFFEMYYYIADEHLHVEIKHETPIVLEIPYRGNLKYPNREIDYLHKCGFATHINRDLMFLNKPDLTKKEVSINNCLVKLLEDVSYTELIVESIKKTFDYYTGDVMSYEEVKQSVDNKEVLAIYLGNSLAGFLRFYFKNNVSWIGHIILFDEFAGKGLGKVLVYEYLKYQIKRDIYSFQHWVVSENNAALKLYEYFGFSKMNKSSISLIKK